MRPIRVHFSGQEENGLSFDSGHKLTWPARCRFIDHTNFMGAVALFVLLSRKRQKVPTLSAASEERTTPRRKLINKMEVLSMEWASVLKAFIFVAVSAPSVPADLLLCLPDP